MCHRELAEPEGQGEEEGKAGIFIYLVFIFSSTLAGTVTKSAK